MRPLAAVVALAAALVTVPLASPLAAQAAAGKPTDGPVYAPPVDRPLVDGFRPPSDPYGPGNRGVDYATAPGDSVGSSADGEVVFAGRVGTGLHVVVLHADGLRTSYSFLATITVRRGDRVAAGQTVGTAGGTFHFGVRAGEVYLDPLLLFAGEVEVHLVPVPLRKAQTEAQEASLLGKMLRGVRRVSAGGAAAIGWAKREGQRKLLDAADTARMAASLAWNIAPLRLPADVAGSVIDWYEARDRCTPAGTPPPRPHGRRRLVLVAGLGSENGGGAVMGVDTRALGYRPADVVQFSYRGGTTADNSYGAGDTQVDIETPGLRLRALLERLQAEEPGVPVDVIAHSQGGLVTRVALGEPTAWSGTDPRLPSLGAVVTLGTPHSGADLATALHQTGRSRKGRFAQDVIDAAGVTGIRPRSTSVGQLRVGSPLIDRIAQIPLPTGVQVTSIAARGDAVVPAGRAHLREADNVIVSVPGFFTDHSDLPASPAAQREIALALAGRAPTCQSLADAVVDGVTSATISRTEQAVGVGSAVGLRAGVP